MGDVACFSVSWSKSRVVPFSEPCVLCCFVFLSNYIYFASYALFVHLSRSNCVLTIDVFVLACNFCSDSVARLGGHRRCAFAGSSEATNLCTSAGLVLPAQALPLLQHSVTHCAKVCMLSVLGCRRHLQRLQQTLHASEALHVY